MKNVFLVVAAVVAALIPGVNSSSVQALAGERPEAAQVKTVQYEGAILNANAHDFDFTEVTDGQVWRGDSRISRLTGSQLTNVDTQSIQVLAGDRGISRSLVSLAQTYLTEISTPALSSYFGTLPKGTHIVLFSTPRSYAKSLLTQGLSLSDVRTIIQQTGGLTMGSDVWIPIYNLSDQAEFADVLTHELTHVVFNQQGIGDTLPTWVNEGTAWELGFAAHTKVDSAAASKIRDEYNQEVQNALETGTLISITAGEDDILTAQYNVEWQDYLAVDQLIKTYGQTTFDSFFKGVKTYGVSQSFQKAYNMDITTYEQDFDNSLKTEKLS